MFLMRFSEYLQYKMLFLNSYEPKEEKKLVENGELIIKIDEFHFTSFHL